MSDYDDYDEEGYDYGGYDDEGEGEYDYGDEGDADFKQGEDYPEDYQFYEDEDRVVAGYRLLEQTGIGQESYQQESGLGTAIDTGRLGNIQQYRAKIQAGETEVFTGEVERILRTALPNVRLTPQNKMELFTQVRQMKQLRYRNPATVLLGYIHHLNVIPVEVLQGYLKRLSKGVTFDRVIAYERYWSNVL